MTLRSGKGDRLWDAGRTGPWLLPYVVGGLTFVAVGLLNPHGTHLVLISAVAASFGGMSVPAWYPGLWARRPPVSAQDGPLGVPLSRAWLAGAAIALLLFVGVLGLGIRFAAGR
jgi:hypothetical protein